MATDPRPSIEAVADAVGIRIHLWDLLTADDWTATLLIGDEDR